MGEVIDPFQSLKNILFPDLSPEQICTLEEEEKKIGAWNDVDGMRAAIVSIGVPVAADALKMVFESTYMIGPKTEASFLNLQLRTIGSAKKFNAADPDVIHQLDHIILGVHLKFVEYLQKGTDDLEIWSGLNHYWKNELDEIEGWINRSANQSRKNRSTDSAIKEE